MKNKILPVILIIMSFISLTKWIQWAESNVQSGTAYPFGLWAVAVGLFITGITTFYIDEKNNSNNSNGVK